MLGVVRCPGEACRGVVASQRGAATTSQRGGATTTSQRRGGQHHGKGGSSSRSSSNMAMEERHSERGDTWPGRGADKRHNLWLAGYID
ncbi:hypothetical protein SESBI_13306 [Sesbania bispinosa]|nr:hypothetical protein SESBI_13306 [Sesbania bispinosa]